MSADEDAYNELCCYTLTHNDPAFIHQHVVDAFAVQAADETTKPIKLTFGLIGLYLKIERKFSGREVQRAHMALARQKHVWPDVLASRRSRRNDRGRRHGGVARCGARPGDRQVVRIGLGRIQREPLHSGRSPGSPRHRSSPGVLKRCGREAGARRQAARRKERRPATRAAAL